MDAGPSLSFGFSILYFEIPRIRCFGIMKTTIDIPEDELADAMRCTGAKTKREAVVAALVDFNRRRKMAELTKYSGSFESLPSNEEIEAEELVRMKRLHGEDFEFRKGKGR